MMVVDRWNVRCITTNANLVLTAVLLFPIPIPITPSLLNYQRTYTQPTLTCTTFWELTSSASSSLDSILAHILTLHAP
jgi:hypothetical protein